MATWQHLTQNKCFLTHLPSLLADTKCQKAPNMPYTHRAANISEVKKQHIAWMLAAPFLLWIPASNVFVVLNELVICLRHCFINTAFLCHMGTSHPPPPHPPNTESSRLPPCQNNLGKLPWCQVTEGYVQSRSISPARSRSLQLGSLSLMEFCYLSC